MDHRHQRLAAGGWEKLSLAEQMGNIGGEVHRALRRQGGEKTLFEAAMSRALELMDLTLADRRWRSRLKELARARELLGGAGLGSGEYKTDLADLDRYFFHFAALARNSR
ncbi:MAG: hypothetical protein ACYCPQ_02270 [Elusimicrobiota bacterium]